MKVILKERHPYGILYKENISKSSGQDSVSAFHHLLCSTRRYWIDSMIEGDIEKSFKQLKSDVLPLLDVFLKNEFLENKIGDDLEMYLLEGLALLGDIHGLRSVGEKVSMAARGNGYLYYVDYKRFILGLYGIGDFKACSFKDGATKYRYAPSNAFLKSAMAFDIRKIEVHVKRTEKRFLSYYQKHDSVANDLLILTKIDERWMFPLTEWIVLGSPMFYGKIKYNDSVWFDRRYIEFRNVAKT